MAVKYTAPTFCYEKNQLLLFSKTFFWCQVIALIFTGLLSVVTFVSERELGFFFPQTLRNLKVLVGIVKNFDTWCW